MVHEVPASPPLSPIVELKEVSCGLAALPALPPARIDDIARRNLVSGVFRRAPQLEATEGRTFSDNGVNWGWVAGATRFVRSPRGRAHGIDLYDASGSRKRQHIAASPAFCGSIASSLDGARLYMKVPDRLAMYDLSTGKLMKEVIDHNRRGVSFAQGGRRNLALSFALNLDLLDAEFDRLAQYRMKTDTRYATLASNARFAVVDCSIDKQDPSIGGTRLFDFYKEESCQLTRQLFSFDNTTFSANSRCVLLSLKDGTAVFDSDGGKLLRKLDKTQREFVSGDSSIADETCAAINHDGSKFVGVSGDAYVICDVESGDTRPLPLTTTSQLTDLQFAPDGDVVVTRRATSDSHRLGAFSVNTGLQLWETPIDYAAASGPLKFSPDERYLMAGRMVFDFHAGEKRVDKLLHKLGKKLARRR